MLNNKEIFLGSRSSLLAKIHPADPAPIITISILSNLLESFSYFCQISWIIRVQSFFNRIFNNPWIKLR